MSFNTYWSGKGNIAGHLAKMTVIVQMDFSAPVSTCELFERFAYKNGEVKNLEFIVQLN